MEVDPEGKLRQNLQKLTECKIRNLIEIPYDQELINKKIGVQKEWLKLSNEEKWKFFGKLKPSTFDKIIRKINEIDSSGSEQKKN
jgi:hypothetical protein